MYRLFQLSFSVRGNPRDAAMTCAASKTREQLTRNTKPFLRGILEIVKCSVAILDRFDLPSLAQKA